MNTKRYYTSEIELRFVPLAANIRASKEIDDQEDNDDDDEADDDDTDENDDDDADEVRSVEGYAAVFGQDSEDLGGFVERIAPKAFKRSLAADNGQIVMLWGHDQTQPPVGSTRSGSLALSTDKKGLRFKLDASRLNAQQLAAVSAGEMRMSFGFTVNDDAWSERSNGNYVRTLNDVDLIETSLVISPAYAGTSAGLRSAGELDEARDAFAAFKQTIAPKYQSRRVELKLQATEILAKLIEQHL